VDAASPLDGVARSPTRQGQPPDPRWKIGAPMGTMIVNGKLTDQRLTAARTSTAGRRRRHRRRRRRCHRALPSPASCARCSGPAGHSVGPTGPRLGTHPDERPAYRLQYPPGGVQRTATPAISKVERTGGDLKPRCAVWAPGGGSATHRRLSPLSLLVSGAQPLFCFVGGGHGASAGRRVPSCNPIRIATASSPATASPFVIRP
jgi:hypothetical protein